MKKLLSLALIFGFYSAEVEAGFGNFLNSTLNGLQSYANAKSAGASRANAFAQALNASISGNNNMYGTNNMYYNAYGNTATSTNVNSNISTILNNMYQQTMLIRQTYPNNANVSTYTANLANALQICAQNPSMAPNYISTMFQNIQGLQSMGINASNLINGLAKVVLNNMYQQTMLIRQTYSNNANVSTYTANLGNALQICDQNPTIISNYLLTMSQNIQGLQNMGINVTNLTNGYTNLRTLSSYISTANTTGINSNNLMYNNAMSGSNMVNNSGYNMQVIGN